MDESEIPRLAKMEIRDPAPKTENKIKRQTMLEKLENAAPYNLFFNILDVVPQTWEDPNSVTFTDLLCPSLGELKCSLQLNFSVDIKWVMEQYKERNLDGKPLTVVYGCLMFEKEDVDYLENNYPNVTHHFFEEGDAWQNHHSKIGIYIYKDGSSRLVISTINLTEKDWALYNNQLWVSPACPGLPLGSTEKDGDSPTAFKSSLLKYLRYYNLEILKPWIEHVANTDFSQIRVFLVTSIPGVHPHNVHSSHFQQMNELLMRHCALPAKDALSWPILAQSNSLGTFGKSPNEWLCGHYGLFMKALSNHQQKHNSRRIPDLNVIYPTVNNVRNSYFGALSARCLSYRKEVDEKQQWLRSYLCQWKADGLDRSRAMPRQKTYCRVSPCFRKLAWFLLTSACLGKSGWASGIRRNGDVFVRYYEAGVLFLPQFFEEEYFEIGCTEKNMRVFPLMYDLPLVKYKEDDVPWCLTQTEELLKYQEE